MVGGALGVRQRRDTAASERRCAAQNDSTRSSRSPNFAAVDGAPIATQSPVLHFTVILTERNIADQSSGPQSLPPAEWAIEGVLRPPRRIDGFRSYAIPTLAMMTDGRLIARLILPILSTVHATATMHAASASCDCRESPGPRLTRGSPRSMVLLVRPARPARGGTRWHARFAVTKDGPRRMALPVLKEAPSAITAALDGC